MMSSARMGTTGCDAHSLTGESQTVQRVPAVRRVERPSRHRDRQKLPVLAPCPRRADPAGQALVTVMIAALATAIIQAPSWGWLSLRTVGLLALAAGALAALAYLEPQRTDSLIEFGLFRNLA